MSTDMTGTPISNHPTNHVVAFIHDQYDLEQIKADLHNAGYLHVRILSGDAALHELQPEGDEPPGILERVKRVFQKFGDEETRLYKIAEKQLAGGDAMILVATDGTDSQIEQVRQLLVINHAHTLIFFGELAVQRLPSVQAPAPVES